MLDKNNVIQNMIWRFAERFGVQGINFIVAIILARILSPDEYGTVALVNVFIAILQVFVDGGFPNALIQKKEATDLDFSTVFYFNIVSCSVMYIILFLVAPVVANFYNNEELINILRILGLKLIVSGLLSVQNAFVSRTLQFKKYFYATMTGTVISAIIGIYMVFNGYGVWALVGQALTSVIVNTIVLWFTSGFKPRIEFSYTILKELFSYGWKLLVASLIGNLYINLRSLIIGKVYSTSDLAYYNKGEDFPKLIVNNLNTAIDSVLFPTMSTVQDDIIRLKSMTRRAIKTSGFIVWPCMTGLFVCAETLVEILLTDSWISCVPYLRLFCISYAFIPLRAANVNAIKAVGRSDVFLRLEVCGKITGLLLIFITMKIGVFAIALGTVFAAIFEMIIKTVPNKKLIAYGYMEQLQDVLPSMMVSIFMGLCVWWLQYLNLPLILVLVIQASVGACIYIALSVIFKMEAFFYMWEMVKGMLEKAFGKVKK